MPILDSIAKILESMAWPLTVVACLLIVKSDLFKFLKNRKITYRNQSKGMELLLEKFEEQVTLTKIQRAEIENLNAHDIWALESFVHNKKTASNMNVASKVMAKSFIEAGLLEWNGEAATVTDKGKRILEIANNILNKPT